MSFKSKKDICIIANKKIIVSGAPLEKLRKSAESRKRQKAEQSAKSARQRASKHKDPLDALGNFVAELDLDRIDADLDFESGRDMVSRIIGKDGENAESIIDENVAYGLCRLFDYDMRQLLAMLMERFPDTFTLGFVKAKVKPFIAGLQKEKLEYHQQQPGGERRYKAIFSVI